MNLFDYDQWTMVTLLSHACSWHGLAPTVSTCADQQFGTNSDTICHAQTQGNSLSVGLRTGYSSMHTAGGASDRR